MPNDSNASARNSLPTGIVSEGRDILRQEGRALLGLADRLDGSFEAAVERIVACPGSVLVTGMGKAGLIGRKISATFSSLGQPSHFLHPAEAIHGDLGCVTANDLVLALSYSGETEEVVRLAFPIRQRGCGLISITGARSSRLGKQSDVVLDLGPVEEAGSLRLAPTTSTVLMLGLGDALALAVSHRQQFLADDFARNHPGGSLGRKLTRVEDAMRRLHECRLADEKATVREVFVRKGLPGRRSGAVMIVDDAGRLAGIFTDSDLARLLERKQDAALDRPIADVMTRNPQTVQEHAWLAEALQLLASRKISELPVINHELRPIGMIDITDVFALEPSAEVAGGGASQTVTCDDDALGDDALADDAHGDAEPRIYPWTPKRI